MTTGKVTPETTRPRCLLDCALHELSLAGDLASAQEDEIVSALINGASRSLRVYLSRVEGRARAEAER